MSRGLIATWGAVASSAIPGLIIQQVNRNAIGDVLDEEAQMAGRDGAWVFPDARGNRIITARATVENPIDTRRAEVSSVASWLNAPRTVAASTDGYTELSFSDEPDRFWRAYLSKAPPVDEWRRTGKLTMEWRAEPYSYSIALSEVCVTAHRGDDGDEGDLGTFDIPDDLLAYPVIEITPLDGYCLGYTLTVNGYELIVNTSIPQGVTQTVSSVSYTITGEAVGEEELLGAYMPDPMWTVDASGEFPLLQPGTNEWAFSMEGTVQNVRICFFWRERLY